ncbi:MAG: hypothetical protein WBW81_09480 [Methylocella sp.]
MAQDNEKKLKKTFSRQSLILCLSLGLSAVFGVTFIIGAVAWKHVGASGEKLLILQIGQSMAAAAAQAADGSLAQPTKSLEDLVKELITDQQDGLGPDVLRDLGIALLIAVFVTVVIELYASRRLREHIAYDVLSAAYAKVVPEEIYTQIRDNVFRSKVYRQNWEVRINVNAPQVYMARGFAILNILYSYDLVNLCDTEISQELSVGIDLDCPLPDEGIPKFKSIKIYDERNRPLVRETHSTALLAKQNEPTRREFIEYTEGKLTFTRNTQEVVFAARVPISPQGKVTVRYEVARAIRVPGDYVLNALAPADGIKITLNLNVEGFKLGVLALHPNPGALRHPQPDMWLFDAGILPWQGFQFTSAAEG